MKTDDLITMLASGPDVAAPALPLQRFALLLAGGVVASVVLMLALLGLRTNLGELAMAPAFWIKMLFVLALVAVAAIAMHRMAIPGARVTGLPLVIAAPVLVLWAIAGGTLLTAESGERAHLFWGDTWRYCAFMIALLSVPVLIAMLRIMRELAPTRLRLSGAAAGFAAGATATLIYSFHCPEVAAPFIGVWYVAGIMIPTVIGLLSGPRLLRW